MGRRGILAVTLALLAVACSDDAARTTTSSPTTSTTPVASTSPEVTDPGRLAILDDTGSIVVMSPDGTDRQLVVEATSQNPAIYTQPVWSPDGSTLAWGQQTGTGFGVGISEPGSGSVVTLTTPSMPFYTYWSPDNRHLGVLQNGTSGVQFQIADLEAETASVLDEDAPLYFTWGPDGSAVVTHAGAERVESIGVNGDRATLEPTSPAYLSPHWTDLGVFHVIDDRLVVEDVEGDREVVADVGGFTLFVANPQGTRVALQTKTDGPGPVTASNEEVPAPPNDVVVVVDTSTGAMEVVSEAPALGFFWSRNGDRLLVLAVENRRVTPTVWAPDGVRTFPAYSPHPLLLETTFPFFPQYAQSVSFWSPGSSAFAFAGVVGEEAGIWVQNLGLEEPTRVSDGSWVAWSSTGP